MRRLFTFIADGFGIPFFKSWISSSIELFQYRRLPGNCVSQLTTARQTSHGRHTQHRNTYNSRFISEVFMIGSSSKSKSRASIVLKVEQNRPFAWVPRNFPPRYQLRSFWLDLPRPIAIKQWSWFHHEVHGNGVERAVKYRRKQVRSNSSLSATQDVKFPSGLVEVFVIICLTFHVLPTKVPSASV